MIEDIRPAQLAVTRDELEKVFGRMEFAKRVYIDCETNGLSKLANAAIGVSISDGGPGEGEKVWARYIPWGHETNEPQALLPHVMNFYRDLVKKTNPAIWRFFNKQFDHHMLFNALGSAPKFDDEAYDVHHLAYLIDESGGAGSHRLKTLGKRHIDPNAADEEDALKPWLGDLVNSGHAKVPPSIEAPYAAQDARLTAQLDQLLYPQAVEQDLLGVLRLETQLIPVIADMELTGVLIDLEYMEQQEKVAEQQQEELRKRFKDLTGFDGSINSPDQLRKLIYEDWGLRPTRFTDSGEPSTDKWAIERLKQDNSDRAEPLGILEEHSKLSTLLEMFFKPIPGLTDENGAVHTSFNQMVRTGRMSASRPNIQQIPAKRSGDPRSDWVRKGFLVRPSRIWLLMDYSQIELRVLAHYSRDERMMQAFRDGEDIHQATADTLGIDRKIAKNVNFADVYGAGVAQLARTAGVSQEEAARLKKLKAQYYPGVKRFSYRAMDVAKARGWVKTVSGRRRRFTEKHYRAANTIIQGSAADVLKQAMVNARKTIGRLAGGEAKLIMAIHDELIFELPAGSERELVGPIREAMLSAFVPPLTCPMEVDSAVTTTNWADEEPLTTS